MPPDPGPTPSCNLCKSSNLKKLFQVQDAFHLLECQTCGHVSTYPLPTAEDVERYYSQSYYGEGNLRFHPIFEEVMAFFRRRRVRMLERYISKGRALDVGCGRGITMAFMRDHGWEVFGVERSQTAVTHARGGLNLPVFIGDFMDFSSDDLFDAIIFWHVLEHIADPAAAIEKSRRLLKPGGMLVIAAPNFESFQAWVTGRHWFHLDIPRHYSHFRLSVLRRFLESREFQIETVRHFSLEQNPYGWLQSMLNQTGFSRNLLYELLKNPSARIMRNPLGAHVRECLFMALLLPLYAPLGLLYFLAEVLCRRGGTVEIYARKKTD